VTVLSETAIDRLLHFRSTGAPVLSAYVGVPPDPAELKGVHARFLSLLQPVRDKVGSDGLTHAQRESLRNDIDRVLEVASRASAAQGRAIGVFACGLDGFYEEIQLPRVVRDRAVVDTTPYLRPLLAVLEESHRYLVVVVSRDNAWFFEFYLGELEAATRLKGRHVRKRDYGGWHGLDEYHARNRAEERARHHYRETAATTEEMFESTGAELILVAGHEETSAEFLRALPQALRDKVVGSFVVDPHTMTPGRVREQADQVVDGYERREEARLVAEALDRVGARALGAAGLPWCLLAVNEKAVECLVIHDDEQRPGRVCDRCGWLGLEGDECPVDGAPTRPTPDVIDEMATTVADSSGRVEHVFAETALADLSVAAFLRFPVPEPS
jgi:peptide chain release factor subunit 1